MHSLLWATGIAGVASLAIGGFRTQDSDLLKELASIHREEIEEDLRSLSEFWNGLGRKDPGGPWSRFIRDEAARFVVEHRLFSKEVPDYYEKLCSELKAQLWQWHEGADVKTKWASLRSDPDIAGRESNCRNRLTRSMARTAAFLERRGDALKSAGIDTADLKALIAEYDVSCKEQAVWERQVGSTRWCTVRGEDSWSDCGVKVKSRDRVFAFSFGFVIGGSVGRMSPTGIDGYDSSRVHSDARYGSLIARLEGERTGFRSLGVRGSFEAASEGSLFLRANCQDHSNKWGAFSVLVIVMSADEQK